MVETIEILLINAFWELVFRVGGSRFFEKNCSLHDDVAVATGHAKMNTLLVGTILRGTRPPVKCFGKAWTTSARKYSNSASSLSELIPIVNVKSFYDNNVRSHGLAKEIARSLNETGFVYIKNSPLTDNVINNCINAAKNFFDQSQNFKNQLRTTETNAFGYYHYQGVGNADQR